MTIELTIPPTLEGPPENPGWYWRLHHGRWTCTEVYIMSGVLGFVDAGADKLFGHFPADEKWAGPIPMPK